MEIEDAAVVEEEKKDVPMTEENSSDQKLSQSGLAKNSMTSTHRLMTFQAPQASTEAEKEAVSIF